MLPANPESYKQPTTSTSGDLFTKNSTEESNSDEGESSLEYAQKVCTVKPFIVKPPGMLPTPERKRILKPDSTVHTGDSDTDTIDTLPSLPNQDDDDTIIISDDSDLEAKMLSFNTEEKQ